MRRALADGSCLRSLALFWVGMVCASSASADKVRITQLSDVNFGTLTTLQTDTRRSQSICVYSNGQPGTYSISAAGSGAGSSFSLSNGPYLLNYDVEWSPLAGQTGGTALTPNSVLSGQTTAATNQQCSSGPAASASLTLVLRGTSLSSARAGNYSGSLTLIIGAE